MAAQKFDSGVKKKKKVLLVFPVGGKWLYLCAEGRQRKPQRKP